MARSSPSSTSWRAARRVRSAIDEIVGEAGARGHDPVSHRRRPTPSAPASLYPSGSAKSASRAGPRSSATPHAHPAGERARRVDARVVVDGRRHRERGEHAGSRAGGRGRGPSHAALKSAVAVAVESRGGCSSKLRARVCAGVSVNALLLCTLWARGDTRAARRAPPAGRRRRVHSWQCCRTRKNAEPRRGEAPATPHEGAAGSTSRAGRGDVELEAPEPDDADVAPRRRRGRRREPKDDSAPRSCFPPCVVCGGLPAGSRRRASSRSVQRSVGARAGVPLVHGDGELGCGGAPSTTCLPPLAPIDSLEDREDAARMLTEADEHALRPLSWETYDRPDGIAGWPDWARARAPSRQSATSETPTSSRVASTLGCFGPSARAFVSDDLWANVKLRCREVCAAPCTEAQSAQLSAASPA